MFTTSRTSKQQMVLQALCWCCMHSCLEFGSREVTSGVVYEARCSAELPCVDSVFSDGSVHALQHEPQIEISVGVCGFCSRIQLTDFGLYDMSPTISRPRICLNSLLVDACCSTNPQALTRLICNNVGV